MKKLFQNPVIAWAILILAVVLGLIIGQVRKPASLPGVEYGVWICDSAKMLSPETENTLTEYNKTWNQKYGAVIAVATVDSIKGWEPNKFADTLGNEWGLGEKDMLLLIYPKKSGVDYWVSQGEFLQENQMDSQQFALKNAIENEIYSQGADAGAEALFLQADVYYNQVLRRPEILQTIPETTQWKDRSGVSIFRVILLIGAIFLVWAVIDRLRYNRYRRRAVVNVVPAVSYYPIFWGRPSRAAAPVPPPAPARPASPPSGTYYRPANTSRPSGSYPRAGTTSGKPANTRPGNPPHPKNSGKGGFGGGKR